MLITKNSNVAQTGVASSPPLVEQAMSGPGLPGATAREMFIELDETENPHPVFSLLKAEVGGLIVRRLRAPDNLEGPPPAGGWLVIIEGQDPWPGEPKNFHEDTLKWLVVAANLIEVNSAKPAPGFYDKFISKAFNGQRVLLILNQDMHLAEWLHEIVLTTLGSDNPEPKAVRIKGAKKRVYLRFPDQRERSVVAIPRFSMQ